MNGNQLAAKRPVSWKTYFILVAITIPAIYIILPFSITMLGEQAAAQLAETGVDMPVWLVFLINTTFQGALTLLLGLAGFVLAAHLGLGLPFIEGQVTGQPIWKRMPRTFGLALPVGVIGALIVIGLDYLFFADEMARLVGEYVTNPESIKPPALIGFLGSISAGITEEILFRMFLVTLFVWIGSLIFRRKEDGRPRPGVLWMANILAAVAFGAGHLPSTMGIGIPLTTLIIIRAILLNGVLALTFGWLYWRYGLETAMFAHFSVDIVVHVILTLAVRAGSPIMGYGIMVVGVGVLLGIAAGLVTWGKRLEEGAEAQIPATV